MNSRARIFSQRRASMNITYWIEIEKTIARFAEPTLSRFDRLPKIDQD